MTISLTEKEHILKKEIEDKIRKHKERLYKHSNKNIKDMEFYSRGNPFIIKDVCLVYY